MEINPNDIKVGDTVLMTQEGVVTHVTATTISVGGTALYKNSPNRKFELIKRPLRVGDTCSWADSNKTYKLLAIYGDRAWICKDGTSDAFTAYLHQLRRIDQ